MDTYFESSLRDLSNTKCTRTYTPTHTYTRMDTYFEGSLRDSWCCLTPGAQTCIHTHTHTYTRTWIHTLRVVFEIHGAV